MQSFQNKNSRDEYVWLEECRRWPGSRRLAASFHFSVQFCKIYTLQVTELSSQPFLPDCLFYLRLFALVAIPFIFRHPFLLFAFFAILFHCLRFLPSLFISLFAEGDCKDHKGNKHHLSRKVWEVTRNVFQWIANVHSLQKEAAFTFFPCSKLMHY